MARKARSAQQATVGDWIYYERLHRVDSDDVAGYFRTRGGVFEEWHPDIRAWLLAHPLAADGYSRSIESSDLMIDPADAAAIEAL